MSKHVLIAGGTGMVGSYLSDFFERKGYNIAVLTRKAKLTTGIKTFHWNPSKGQIDKDSVKWADIIINLAGANIGNRRWTEKRKALLYSSRIESTRLLLETVKTINPSKFKTYITASATGYYGMGIADPGALPTTTKPLTESSPPGDDFLAQTCMDWETEADRFSALGIRVVKIRTGIVISRESILMQIAHRSRKVGIIGIPGTGKQPFPWIHIHDLARIYTLAIQDSGISGVYNAVAPHLINFEDMARTFEGGGKIIRIKAPGWIVKTILGEMAGAVLRGYPILPDKLLSAGFDYKYGTIQNATDSTK